MPAAFISAHGNVGEQRATTLKVACKWTKKCVKDVSPSMQRCTFSTF